MDPMKKMQYLVSKITINQDGTLSTKKTKAPYDGEYVMIGIEYQMN